MKAGKQSGRAPWCWMLVLALAWTLAGCKPRAADGAAAQVDLADVLRQLPDSLRENPFGAHQPLGLSATAIDLLIAQGEVATGEGMGWRLQYQDSSHDHLRIQEWGVDDGLHYDFVRLPVQGGDPWVLAVQGLDDHCCNYNRWALYACNQGKLKDRTREGLPQLGWADFFTPAAIGAQPPPPPQGNRHPFFMTFQAHPPEIHVQVSADYLELNYSEAETGGMLADLPSEPKVLVWQNGRFEWKKK